MNVRDLIAVLRAKERKDVKLTYLEIKSHEIEPSQDYVNNIRCKMCGLVHLSISIFEMYSFDIKKFLAVGIIIYSSPVHPSSKYK